MSPTRRRAAERMIEALEYFRGRQLGAIRSLRSVVERLDDVAPDIVDDPAVRRRVVVAIGDYYEKLAETTMDRLLEIARRRTRTQR